jgi:membrane protein CcdC involved in cytochrome C biogenesis
VALEMQIVPMIITLAVVVLLVVWRRNKAMRKPIKGKGFRIILPIIIFLIFIPLITIQIMFDKSGSTIQTGTLPSITEMIVAFLLGIVLSVPMVMTTNYEIREDNQVYARKSTAFIYALVGLIVIRFVLRDYFSSMNPMVLSLLSTILAFGYVGVWRVVSFIKFRRVLRQRESRS